MQRLVEKIAIAAVPLQTCGNRILCDVSVTDQLTSAAIVIYRLRNRYNRINLTTDSRIRFFCGESGIDIDPSLSVTLALVRQNYINMTWIIWHAKEKQEKLVYFTTDWIWHITLHLKSEAFVNIFTKFVVRLVFSFSTFSKYKFSIYIFLYLYFTRERQIVLKINFTPLRTHTE